MKSHGLRFIICLTIFTATGAIAGPDILPGLWENKIELTSKSGQIEAALEQAEALLASMPPEQQKMMKDMMAKQGVNFDFANRTLQSCLTKEQISNFELAETREGCTQSFEETSKNHFALKLSCQDQSMSGQGEWIIQDQKHYSGTIVMDVNMNGQQDVMTMKQVGEWKSSNCGDLQK